MEAASEKNDKLIVHALGELQDPAKRGKRKPTVAVICQMTGLSRNTVRSRAWALDKLKAIKVSLKAGEATQATAELSSELSAPTPRMLRERIKSILGQNALLYEEILSLRRIVASRDETIRDLKAAKIAPFPPPRGRATE
ncbi:hypothetical protein [Paraburkholderia sp. JHI869]|uniref:hypothetical protein n=1 Tax=Paraburkholderia sp. JHI869 TaxID=3112959 RepID=UPI003170929A